MNTEFLRGEVSEVDQKISKLTAANDVNSIFDGFLALAILVHKVAEAKRKASLERRRERARMRYAVAKATGRPPKKIKAKPEPEPEPDYYEAPTSCECAVCGHPPCSWCENWSEDGE